MQSFSVQRDVHLGSYNTLAVPARAKYLVEVDSETALTQVLAWAKQKQLAVFILGDGSNTVFASDYDGVVIVNRICGIDVLESTDDEVIVNIGGGEDWHSIVSYALEQGWYGLENLALIPGRAGAAPMQNIGAYGVEIASYIEQVHCLWLNNAENYRLGRQQCEFGYRDSVFKNRLRNKLVVTSIELRLPRYETVRIDYPDLQAHFANSSTPTAKQVFQAVCEIRSKKLPSPSALPNAGSFFKNPVIGDAGLNKLKAQYPGLVAFKFNKQHKLAAAWLIEQAGWKARSIDDVCVHSEQALVITNPGRRSGQTILKFANTVQQDIFEKFGIQLEIEPVIHS